MRKFTAQEIAALRQQKFVIFTEFELDLLAKGDTTFRLERDAEKALDKFRSHLQMPMARGESEITFLTKQEFNQTHGQLADRLLFLTQTLIKKGLITKAEISLAAHEMITETWVHLCDICKYDFAICGTEKPKFSIELFPDLTGELSRKIIQCDKFEEKVDEIKEEVPISET